MGLLLSAGHTILDNAVQLQAVLTMPDRCVKAYLFLLSRSRLRSGNRRAHWGEVASAIGKGQTQTAAALKELAAAGLVETDGMTWACPVVASESRRKSPGISPESRRKSGMSKPKKAVQDSEKPAPESRESIETREEEIKECVPAPSKPLRASAAAAAKPEKTPTPHQALMGALVLTCYGSWEGLTAGNTGRAGKAAREMLAAGYSPDDVPLIAQHIRASWRDVTLTPPLIADRAAGWRNRAASALPRSNQLDAQDWAAAAYEAEHMYDEFLPQAVGHDD